VNLAYYGIPQFAEVFPDRYKQDWRALPREIPDSFVRKFGEWCHQEGVKGKYSIVPNPACTGWIDRDIPGWTKQQLRESLQLVRTLMTPDWDIHPEMITHTWVIDTKTGRPYPEQSERFMENFGWSVGKSADELADYISYALRILKNVELPCEGITTPGGFAGRSLPQFSRAVLESCRDVYRAEVPHYFRHAFLDDRSVAPRVENAAGLQTANPRCVVSIIACTSDWFGGWDGLTPGSVENLITADGKGGRLPQVIRRGEPAVIACHWPGIYYNGEERGFRIFQETVKRLQANYDNLVWMKLSEIARYWAARELTRITRNGQSIRFHAPFACPGFTVRVAGGGTPHRGETPLREVKGVPRLTPGTFSRDERNSILCFDLPKGDTEILM
jgi:hypothetical protein